MSEPTTRDEVKALFRREVAGWVGELVSEAYAAARTDKDAPPGAGLGRRRLGSVILDAQEEGNRLVDRIVDAVADALKRNATVKVVQPDAPKALPDGGKATTLPMPTQRKQA